MGFSITAANLVVFVGVIGAGSVAATSFWKMLDDVGEARYLETDRATEIAHTNITIIAEPTYQGGGNLRYIIDLKNTGSTVLRVNEMSYVVDGVWTNVVESDTVEGDATTNLWLPGEQMEVRLKPIATRPDFLWVVTGNGVATYYRR